MILPDQVIEASNPDPKNLVIYGKPKVGKTKLVSFLPDTLILDLEDGARYVSAKKVKIIGLKPPKEKEERKEARHKKREFYLTEVITSLIDYKKDNGEYKYKRLAVDTGTKLEEWAETMATEEYTMSLQAGGFNRVGEDKKGALLPRSKWKSVLTLPRGAGYRHLRDSFNKLLNTLQMCAEDIILICHVRISELEKAGRSVKAKDLDLTGGVGRAVAAWSDAIGYVSRNKNKTVISFKNPGGDSITGVRVPGLNNKELEILEFNDEGEVVKVQWELLYPSLTEA